MRFALQNGEMVTFLIKEKNGDALHWILEILISYDDEGTISSLH